ncbi:hypothetical protein Tco_0643484 [Tanacetum coccineum]
MFYADEAVFVVNGYKSGRQNMTRVQAWTELIDKVKSRLSNWKLKSLSIGAMQFFNGMSSKVTNSSWVNWGIVCWRPRKDVLEFQAFLLLTEPYLMNCVLLERFINEENNQELKDQGSGEFSVASIRRFIDDQRLLTVDSKTLWIKSVPIKVNILAWKIKLEALS